MKIHIAYNSKYGPWGGGNQFLKALRDGFVNMGVHSESIGGADVVLFNSYHDLGRLLKAYILYSNKKLIYRLGPIFYTYRKSLRWKIVDQLTILMANLCADLIIFQSEWSYCKARNLGLWKNKKYTIILNAVDTSIFPKKEFKDHVASEKIKLVYTSWSSNMKKGFAYLKFLDEHLDFTKYEFSFVGNSPFEFKNIKVLKALPSAELGSKLRESDIYISPVEDDACSNALLEGLSSGLPVVALDSGGNGELVGKGGEMFTSEAELLERIDKVAKNMKFYYDAISVKTIAEIARKYIEAIKHAKSS